MIIKLRTMLFLALLTFAQVSVAASPNLTVTNAWVRASAPGQSVGAAYLTLKSNQDLILVKVSTVAAEYAEIHSMSMTSGIMKMRMLPQLELKSGKTYQLTPGQVHVMLFKIKQVFKVGDKVMLTLTLKNTSNQIVHFNVNAVVKES